MTFDEWMSTNFLPDAPAWREIWEAGYKAGRQENADLLIAFGEVSKASNTYLRQLTAAEMSVRDYRAKNAILREALEWIAHVNEPYPLSYCMRTATEALQRAGGDK